MYGFHKRTEKTPKNEIERAERLNHRYYEERNELTLCSNIYIICGTWPKAARPRYGA